MPLSSGAGQLTAGEIDPTQVGQRAHQKIHGPDIVKVADDGNDVGHKVQTREEVQEIDAA